MISPSLACSASQDSSAIRCLMIGAEPIGICTLIPHRYHLADIEEAYRIFENRLDGVIKIAITESILDNDKSEFVFRRKEHINIMIEIAQGLANILELGNISRMAEDAMGKNERGFSGAKVVREKVFFSNGTSASMIFKRTDRKERCAMQRLTEQKQCSPACYSEDLQTDAPCWMAMEDLGQQRLAEPCDLPWLRSVADSLASIHSMNMNKGGEMPWLPIADEAYWQSVVTTLSVDHFARKMEQNAEFNQEFGGFLPKLREIGQQFAKDMSALSREKDAMPLTHGDLQTRDGAHIYCCDGTPRIIDFGFCRYAPFYIDLAGWFGRDELKFYYDALCKRGWTSKYADFEERARAAYRYNGFIYLCPSVMDWEAGPTEQTGKRLLQALYIILHGDFPERNRAYSDELFSKILKEHQNQSL